MYEFVWIVLCVGLIISARYFHYLSKKLGPQKYMQHMVFEGLPANNKKSDLPFYKIISIPDLFCLGLLVFYIIRKDLFHEHEYVWQMVIGFIVMLYAFLLGASLASILVYKYALQHPEQISGQTHFKSGMVQTIQKSIILQIIIPCTVLAFMLPSPLIYGVLVALSVLFLIVFRKLSIF